MSVEKITGIVLKELPHGENSKHLVVLAKERGRMFVTAKGAKKPKSKLMAPTQLFTYSEFTVFHGNGFFSVNQAEVIESFYGLRQDVEILAHAMYLGEFLDKTCPDAMEMDSVLQLLLQTFWRMAQGKGNPRLLTRIFELKYLEISGFLPQMDACVFCGGLLAGSQGFSVSMGGCTCQNHRGEWKLLPAVKQAMNHVFDHELPEIFRFQLAEEALIQLESLLEAYIREQMGVSLPSRNFLKGLPNFYSKRT